MSIKRKLVLFIVIATVLPAILIILLFNLRMSTMLVDKNVEMLSGIANERVQAEMDAFDRLETAIFELSTSARMIDFLKTVGVNTYRQSQSQMLTAEIAEKLESFRTLFPAIRSACVFPAGDGISLLRGEYDPAWVQSYHSIPEFQRALEQPSILLRSVTGGGSEHPVLALSIGISDRYAERVVGCLDIRMDLSEYFSGLSMQSAGGMPFFVVSSERCVLYEDQGTISGEAFLTTQAGGAVKRYSDNVYELAIESERYVIVEAASSTGLWDFLYCVNQAEITRDVQWVSLLTLVLTLIFAVFFIAGIMYMFIKIYAPIRQLTETMLKVDEGNLDLYVEVRDSDEIGMLGRAYNRLIDKVKALLKETKETQKKKAELEMASLQAQITPHFLYNVLNSIKALARLKRNDDVIHMTGALIDLLRLAASRANLIPLKEEIEYCTAYMRLMSYRTGISYALDLKIQEEIRQAMIPKFTLQPIIENSILHGFFEDSPEEARILVAAREEGGLLHVTVTDNGKGISKHKEEELNRLLDGATQQDLHRFSGIGIDNIRQKLALEFGPGVQMQISQAVPQGTTVDIAFPLRMCDGVS